MPEGLIHDGSQEARIRQLLEQRGGDGWVSALDLSRISLQYCARICCLRKAGMQIENRVEIVDGTRHGFYRIARPAVQVPLIADREIARRWRDPEEGGERA
jgi:hypothetical protein